MAKKKAIAKPDTRQIAVGLFCKILRPNLWAGLHCRVEGYDERGHIIRVLPVKRSTFQARAKFEELELV